MSTDGYMTIHWYAGGTITGTAPQVMDLIAHSTYTIWRGERDVFLADRSGIVGRITTSDSMPSMPVVVG